MCHIEAICTYESLRQVEGSVQLNPHLTVIVGTLAVSFTKILIPFEYFYNTTVTNPAFIHCI